MRERIRVENDQMSSFLRGKKPLVFLLDLFLFFPWYSDVFLASRSFRIFWTSDSDMPSSLAILWILFAPPHLTAAERTASAFSTVKPETLEFFILRNFANLREKKDQFEFQERERETEVWNLQRGNEEEIKYVCDRLVSGLNFILKRLVLGF